MSNQTRRIRFLGAPYADRLFDAHVEEIAEAQGRRGKTIVMMLRPMRLLAPPASSVVDGQPCAVARGERTLARLRFEDAEFYWRNGVFERFAELPPEHGARRLFNVSCFRDPLDKPKQRIRGAFYWVVTGSEEPGDLAIRAKGCALEEVASPPEPAVVVRRWASPPPASPYLAPHRPALHCRFGGDPITIRLGNRVLHNRLFIGGLHHQRERRPNVDAVLNLCGLDNPWCERYGQHPSDRMSARGEGPHGMLVDDVMEEAGWVARQLRAGKRVLVHCYAGMNRSATVCCAALMLLEGIGAEEALARVRRRHPLAWPDPYHWFALQWLSGWTGGEVEPGASGETEGASLLREISAVG